MNETETAKSTSVTSANMPELGYMKGIGIWYKGELRTINKKEDTPLQPVFEVFTNALEAIRQKSSYSNKNGSITLSIYKVSDMISATEKKYDFRKIAIQDTGIGFTDSEYERFINLRDDRK